MNILYILTAILLLGILVTVHEFGHFIAARSCGIAVSEFAIGFGPKLFSRVSKEGGTRFSLRLIPMGGFCAFIGEDDVEGKEQNDPRAFPRQAVWKRMITVLMGPGMNFLLALVVCVGFLWIGGLPLVDTVITEVTAGSPAEAAGLQSGDVPLRVNGVDIGSGSTEAFTAAISAWDGGEPLAITVLRNGEEQTLSVTPFFDTELNRYRLGCLVQGAYRTDEGGAMVLRPCSFPEALSGSWNTCVNAGGTILQALRALVTTGEGFEDTSGPIGIISIVSQEVRTGGLDAFINLLAVISINLGIMNLLPIPGLDGSRFLFLVLEAIRRKPIPQKKEAAVNLVGMGLLFAFILFISARDVLRLFQ